MNALTTARNGLKDVLGDTYRVEPTVPEEIDLPCLIVQADDPYLTTGESFDPESFGVAMKVYLCPEYVDNDQLLNDLDQMLADVVPLLARSEWAITNIAPPGQISANGWVAYAVVVSVANYINLTAPEA